MGASRGDYEAKLAARDRRIDRGIEAEARLTAEVEGLTRQLEVLRG